MSGPSELAIAVGVVADAGLKASALVGLGWAAQRAGRRGSAAQRHAAWVAVFAAMPLLPALAAARGPALALDAPWLLVAWALGVAAALVPFGVGGWRLRALRAGAVPHPTEAGVWTSDAVRTPVTWGVFRPVVLLPSGWSEAATAAALAHERAHVARRDWLVHALTWGVCAALWFNPLVWWARAALAREAEHAADDDALAAGVRPSDYAAVLLSLARAGHPPALGAAASPLADRVRAVLDTRARGGRRWPAGVAALAVSSSLSVGMGGAPAGPSADEAPTCQPGPLP